MDSPIDRKILFGAYWTSAKDVRCLIYTGI